MKIIRHIVTLVLFLLVVTPSMAQRVSLKFSETPLSVVLRSITDQTDLSLAYSAEVVDLSQRVSVDLQSTSLESALTQVLDDTHISYKVEEGKIFLFGKSTPPAAKSVSSNISGEILDDAGNPIIGATIAVKEGTNGTISNIDGSFSLSSVSNSDTLVVSYLGFVTQEIPVGSRSNFNITMSRSAIDLNEIVVVGYGTQKKANITGSIAILDMKSQDNQPITNASSALYSMPGVYINQSSFKPGNDEATIRIRGVGTLSSTYPLVLVDGFEYDIMYVNPNDIESISVLKDASASIYGSKAANGVILITTKSGKAGAPKISVNAKYGVQTPTYLPDVVTDAVTYMEMRNKAVMNEGQLIGDYTDAQIEEYKIGRNYDKYIYPSTDWYDLCYDMGQIQQYDARLSGGADNLTYTIAGGYMNQQGVLVHNDSAERFSWDVKVNVKASERLTVGASILGTLLYDKEPCYTTNTTVNVINRAIPIMSSILYDGKYGNSWLYTPGRNNIENPLMEIYEGGTKRTDARFIASLNLDYSLPFGIKYKGNLGYNKIDRLSKLHVPQMYTYNPKTMAETKFNTSAPRVKDYDTNSLALTIYNTLSYDKDFTGGHNLSVMVGEEYKRSTSASFQAYAEGFFDNNLTDLNAGSVDNVATGSSAAEYLHSFFSRLGYSFSDRYLMDVTVRYDGSSKFAPGNRWSFFPAVSLGWRIDQEPFMKSVADVTMLKLRASVGQMGNQAIGNYEYLSTVSTSSSDNYSFNDTLSPGGAIVDFVDETISWETTTSYNVGLDLNMYKNKLYLSTDVYHKRTSGILRPAEIPSQIGNLSAPIRNVGVVDNDGVEVEMKWQDKIGEVEYSVGGNFSYNKNEVVELKGEEISTSFLMTREGESINSWWLYQADGFYNSYEEINESVTMSSNVKPGYIRLVNQNDDNILDNDDRIIAGNSVPTINYGFNMSAGWKGITLYTQFQGVADVVAYLSGNNAVPFWNGAGVTKEWLTDAWTPENKNSRLPILTTATGAPEMYSSSSANTQWLYDASYLRLKILQLSYDLPISVTKPMGIDKCQVFVNAHNLLTFSPMKMFDPEKVITSTNIAQYPSLKSFNVGVNLTF